MQGRGDPEKQICPVCQNTIPANTICTECGFDPSCDAEKYATLTVHQNRQKAASALQKSYIPRNAGEGDQATDPIRKAAQNGDCAAQYRLGKRYLEEGKPKAEIGVEWLRKAALQGYAPAECEMGNCCYHGLGMKRNYNAAYYWYCRAAEQGNHEAEYHLGMFLRYGLACKKNTDQALYWLNLSAKHGNLNAKNELKKVRNRFWSALH